MSETGAHDPFEPAPVALPELPDLLRDVAHRDFWDKTWAHIHADLANIKNMLPETPALEIIERKVDMALAITVHQEKVVERLALQLGRMALQQAPKPKKPRKPYTRKAKVIEEPF
jgi:hypothetical protein